jgi:hypothetical protein
MKKSMQTGRLLVRVGLGILAAVAVAAATVTLVNAFNPQPDPPGDLYGLVGIVAGQTLELKVANYALTPDLTGRAAPPPCVVTLILFNDIRGVETVAATKEVTLGAGQSDGISVAVSLPSLNGATTFGPVTGAARTYYRPEMYFHKPVIRPGQDSCVSSAEVINATGETSQFINPALAVESLTSNHNETLVIDTDR